LRAFSLSRKRGEVNGATIGFGTEAGWLR
jgi:hypothetical protein